jgi:hypothetical protein
MGENSQDFTSLGKDVVSRLASFFREYVHESDRACVILCAAKMDYLLVQILTRFLLPSTSKDDELLDSEKALGSFSSHILACYRLGLIDADLMRALNLLRRLRNSFAHETSSGSLDAAPHRDRIREMLAPLNFDNESEKSKKLFQNIKRSKPATEARVSFETMMAVLSVRLERTYHETRRVATAYTGTLLPKTRKPDSPS